MNIVKRHSHEQHEQEIYPNRYPKSIFIIAYMRLFVFQPSYLDYPSPPGDGLVRQGSRIAGSPAQLKC